MAQNQPSLLPGASLFILDFGDFEMCMAGVVVTAQSGKLWRLDLA